MKFYRVKDWAEKQHYKDRTPPWIKFHAAILGSYRFANLSLASKALAPLIWLLASQYKDPSAGIITSNHEEISFKVHIPVSIINNSIKELIENDYLEVVQDASNMLADCKQVATPETETYRKETETDIPLSPLKKSPQEIKIPSWLDEKVWNDFVSHRKSLKKPLTKRAMELSLKELEKLKAKGFSPENVINQSIMRGWIGLFEIKNDEKKKAEKKQTYSEMLMEANEMAVRNLERNDSNEIP